MWTWLDKTIQTPVEKNNNEIEIYGWTAERQTMWFSNTLPHHKGKLSYLFSTEPWLLVLVSGYSTAANIIRVNWRVHLYTVLVVSSKLGSTYWENQPVYRLDEERRTCIPTALNTHLRLYGVLYLPYRFHLAHKGLPRSCTPLILSQALSCLLRQPKNQDLFGKHTQPLTL
jgi:hypothetical protein